jgi:hypothetical protein
MKQEPIRSETQIGSKREIITKCLAEFVIKRVDELAKRVIGKKQDPQYFRGRDPEDYVLASW